ncbi:MAG TPA: N-acyl homoserine lactonase family protein [Hyphomicrobiaceae bacterium]|nr:N-acyl homoserine lactonase family protein [Hyphomicrobiaceae bacterium]
MSDTYEILALKYGRHANRTRFDNFMSADDHATPQPIDYFVWVIRNDARTILVDTGFDHAEAKLRSRVLDREPVEALAQIGIKAETIETVIVSHLHYDHAGTFDRFPAADFHLQEAEMAYATGACMCDEALRKPFTADHVCTLVKKVYSGRVKFHDGDGQVAPGVTVHKAGGHSMGLQCVRVKTQSGHVVLASDATHLYENFEKRKPFSITVNVAETLKSYTKLEQLATSRAHVVPGHDPMVLERYPAMSAATQGIVHRLDVPRLK